ncbi:MAG: thiamine-triphosphatase-like [Parcubacteria group bacterium Gr01-1014_72]|jgi:adenylate cyclase class IV|nr:MAG: thiamine-triphosphatase-like [Parcubacteria group bacterium Gr01-1014_72]
MIEVEKNFDLRKGDKERLIKGADFIGRKVFTDVYHDTTDFSLTSRDYWLRTRDGRFELKVPLNQEEIGSRRTDQYQELETDGEIISALGLSCVGIDLVNALADAGYKQFATIITTRESYRKADFHLDFDETDFGFSTFEVECMVNGPSEVAVAESRILQFAKEHSISNTVGHGKVIEYILRRNPLQYEVLQTHGVVHKHR